MPLAPIIGSVHDNGAKLILLKAYTPLIGIKATTLLMHLCNSVENEYRQIMQGGKLWHKQNFVWMQYHTTLSESGLRKAKDKLVGEGLIEVDQQQGYDRTTLWRVCEDKLARFFSFAHAVRMISRPINIYEQDKWQAWCEENQSLLEEFGHLWADKASYTTDDENIEMVRTKWPLNIKNRMADKPVKKQPDVKPCRYVEHWNTQPSVPKCRLGSKSYETARAFFKAHRYYKAGQKDFILAEDEQARLKLDIVNKVPKKGKNVRPDSQMKDHIELAALAYNPEFTPQNKSWLPNSLPQFLYNSFSKRGETSLFLERLYANQPQPIDDASRQALIDRADEQELDVVAAVKRVYNNANDRDDRQDLDLRELRAAITIARNILKKYMEIPVQRLSILANHFGSYFDFVEWWENYMNDGHTWKGMPITALDTNKDLWRRFVDFVNADISYNIFTGERME